jgi:hypothetical protein
VGLGWWYAWANTFGSAYAREQGDMYADLAVENYNAAASACAKGV